MPTRDIDVSALDAEFRPSELRVCIVAKFVEDLPETDRENFQAALESDYTNPEISAWLRRKGHPSSPQALDQSVARHRKQRCICG